jgi:alkylation response protein AidB-like acyl-CoA dehydrogenase
MNILIHPSAQLRPDWLSTIRDNAAMAENDGKLQPAQLELAYRQHWFKMLVPKQYGGLELSLPDEVRLIEAISWGDGSMGWAITLCTGAGWFGGFLDAGLSKQIFADPKVCLAGSGAPGGLAVLNADGYKISGTWKYASGALHATHFTANCIINKPDGNTEIRPFIFDKSDVTVLPAWNYNGMVATGSHSFSVQNVQVKPDRIFKIDPEFAIVPNTLYQYPFHQLAEATLAVNISGLAIHFIDLCQPLFEERKVSKNLSANQCAELDEALAKAIYRLNSVRPGFYDVLDASWADYLQNGKDPKPNLQKISTVSRKLAKTAIQIADELYPYCGLIAASTGSDINRVWRDLHTASQHALLTFAG